MLYTFPRITPSLSLCAVAVLLPPPPHTHARRDALAHAHVQYGKTALLLACANKHEGAAAELMDATKLASALNLQGQFKLSALHLASAKGMAGTVAKLLSLGADAALTDATGKTPLDWADAEEVKAVLREQGGKHSIFYAAEGMPELVAELVKEGADAALTNVEGFTALMMACKNKHEAAAAELMEATKLAGALDLQVPHEAGQGGCVV